MKQVILYIIIVFAFSCKSDTPKSKMVESIEKQIDELEKLSTKVEKEMRLGDSLTAILETAIEEHKFVPDVTIIDEQYSLNPFELKKPILKNLFKSQYSSVDTTLFNNRHVDNQVDTLFTFNYGSSFIEIYKNSSEEFIQNGFSNSDTLILNHGLKYGMNKADFLKLLSKDSISNSNNKFRLQNPKITQNVDFKFVNNRLEYIHFEGYLD